MQDIKNEGRLLMTQIINKNRLSNHCHMPFVEPNYMQSGCFFYNSSNYFVNHCALGCPMDMNDPIVFILAGLYSHLAQASTVATLDYRVTMHPGKRKASMS